MMLHAVSEAYGGAPSQRIGLDSSGDPMLCLAFDAEVLVKARQNEKEQMDAMRDGGGNPEAVKEMSKKWHDEWVASMPEGSALRAKVEGIIGKR